MTRTRSLLRQRGQARARMFINIKMGWLAGFPLAQKAEALVWQTLPTSSGVLPQQVEITRTQLQQANFAYSKLIHRFPHALPRVVDDIDAWRSGVALLLSLLKASIHDGEALPRSLLDERFFSAGALRLSAEIKQSQPTLIPLINAISWLTCLSPRSLTPALKWVDSNGSQLSALLRLDEGHAGLITALTLWELQQRDGAKRVAPLLHLLTSPHIQQFTLDREKEYIGQWLTRLRQAASGTTQKPLPAFAKPTLTASSELHQWLQWLFKQRSAMRRRALELFAALDLIPLLPLRTNWWQQLDALLLPWAAKRSTPEEASALIEQVEQLQSDAPSHLPLKLLLNHINWFAEHNSAETNRAFTSTLTALPALHNSVPTRAAFLHSWRNYFYDDSSTLGLWLQKWQRLLTSTLMPHILASWSRVFDRWLTEQYYPRIPSALLLDDAKPQQWQLALDLLPQLLSSLPPLNHNHFILLNHLCRLSAEPQWIIARFMALADHEMADEYDEFDFTAMRFCTSITETAEQFTTVYGKLHKKEMWRYDFTTLHAISSELAVAGWLSLVGGMIADNQIERFNKLATSYKLLNKIGSSVSPPATPIPSTRPQWVANYPEPFAVYLAVLTELSDNAETVAQRVLGKAFPTKDQLSAEIAHLKTLPPNDGLQKRLATLQRRLLATPQPTAHQIGKFGRKLQHAIWRSALDQWEMALTATLHNALSQWLELDQLPVWLSAQPELKMLIGLMDLSPHWQKLGRQLLQQRAGEPPWTLHEHPANQQFIASMRQRGLAMQHWLTPPPAQTVQATNGQTVTLQIDDDPLAIFQMGSHFDTCLSIGSFNYFSVFANAADINKRVLFAYDDRGRVLGRCLIALSNNAGLLTFHPYCHHADLKFTELVAQFVNVWAKLLGSSVLPKGPVAKLVAADWYDDGAVDLCQRFPFLEDGSAWRKTLASLPADEFLPALERAFAPLVLNEMTLPLVLALPELDNRPNLILPLLPLLSTQKSLPQDSWLLILRYAHRANAQRFVEQSLDQHLIPHLHQTLRREYWYLDERLWEMLAEYRPSLALRLLRQSRSSYIAGDEHENSEQRIRALIRIFEQLNRPKQAAALRNRLATVTNG